MTLLVPAARNQVIHWLLLRAAVYVIVATASGLLFVVGAAIYSKTALNSSSYQPSSTKSDRLPIIRSSEPAAEPAVLPDPAAVPNESTPIALEDQSKAPNSPALLGYKVGSTAPLQSSVIATARPPGAGYPIENESGTETIEINIQEHDIPKLQLVGLQIFNGDGFRVGKVIDVKRNKAADKSSTWQVQIELTGKDHGKIVSVPFKDMHWKSSKGSLVATENPPFLGVIISTTSELLR